jgi:GT2 family glycosyltransferase
LRNLVQKAERLRSFDPAVAGLGTSGSRFDYRRCRLVKPPSRGASEVIDVDYLATNMFPLFSVAAVRDVGTFREDLFFGHDEVEFGLRLRRHGYRLCRLDSTDQTRRPSATSWRLGSVGWRRYYALRNIIVISREYCGPITTLRVTLVRGFLKPLLNMLVEPSNALRHLRLNTRAVVDAYRGRMGRTVEPRLVGGELDKRERRVRSQPPARE